ncbi:MAG TPA: PilZ domain-containing protein [Bryobacteraceae bacterium]|nr:PilZ domain-containing protein [Sphingomonas sp.]
MDLAELHANFIAEDQSRKFARFDVQCRARICIGQRQYAGYLDNISRGGAKIRTITLIRKPGPVLLHIPDLPPFRCDLRWADSHCAGLAFELELSSCDFVRWMQSRTAALRAL